MISDVIQTSNSFSLIGAVLRDQRVGSKHQRVCSNTYARCFRIILSGIKLTMKLLDQQRRGDSHWLLLSFHLPNSNLQCSKLFKLKFSCFHDLTCSAFVLTDQCVECTFFKIFKWTLNLNNWHRFILPRRMDITCNWDWACWSRWRIKVNELLVPVLVQLRVISLITESLSIWIRFVCRKAQWSSVVSWFIHAILQQEFRSQSILLPHWLRNYVPTRWNCRVRSIVVYSLLHEIDVCVSNRLYSCRLHLQISAVLIWQSNVLCCHWTTSNTHFTRLLFALSFIVSVLFVVALFVP